MKCTCWLIIKFFPIILILEGTTEKCANVTKQRSQRLKSQQFMRATTQEDAFTKVWSKCADSTLGRENDSNTSKPRGKDPSFPEKDSSGIKWLVSLQQFPFIKIDNRHNHCQNRASTLDDVLIYVFSKFPTHRHQAIHGRLDAKWRDHSSRVAEKPIAHFWGGKWGPRAAFEGKGKSTKEKVKWHTGWKGNRAGTWHSALTMLIYVWGSVCAWHGGHLERSLLYHGGTHLESLARVRALSGGCLTRAYVMSALSVSYE